MGCISCQQVSRDDAGHPHVVECLLSTCRHSNIESTMSFAKCLVGQPEARCQIGQQCCHSRIAAARRVSACVRILREQAFAVCRSLLLMGRWIWTKRQGQFWWLDQRKLQCCGHQESGWGTAAACRNACRILCSLPAATGLLMPT